MVMLVMIIGVASVQAQGRRGQQPAPGQEQMHQRGQRGLERKGPPKIPGLTEEQQEQMKAIHLEMEKAALPVRNQIGEKEARLKTLITAESYDEKAVNKTIDEIGALRVQVEKLRVATLQKAKQVLNEDQLLFLYKHMDKKPGQRPGHRQGR